ncbi:MAG: histone deacetylase [Desulfovermiculus sp.]|nr:histone deacetylase [Desulfovermiculus sp.]
MILYDEQDTVSLRHFGILIPVHHSKATRTLQELRTHPVVGARADELMVPTGSMEITREDILRAHTAEYVDRLFSAQVELEVMTTYELVRPDGIYNRYDPDQASRPLSGVFDRALAKVSGAVQCCRLALKTGFCFYLGGGMHHAHANQGKGFCLVNDVVISLRKLQSEGAITTAWVIDVDAHKGDGTASITKDDPGIVTMSVHMAEGWPLDEPEYMKGGELNPSFTASDIDIEVASGDEGTYLDRLQAGLQELKGYPRPDLALVLSGADPYELDELHSTAGLRLSLSQLLTRDQLIYNFLHSQKVPQACLMAGGYGLETWRVYTQFLEWVLGDSGS